MIRAIIVDDESRSIRNLLWELGSFKNEIEVVDSFTEPEKALLFLQSHTVDVVFLDIEMPTMDGFMFLEQVGDVHFSVVITTAYNEYALKALKKEAHDYLLKPINESHLKETIEKLKKRRKATDTSSQMFEKILVEFNEKLSNKRIAVSTDGCLIFIESQKIICAEADGSYTTLYVEGEKDILLSKKLGEVEKLLEGKNFYRIHNSYIVNLYKIKKFHKTDGYVIMENNKKIPVSRSKRIDFLSQF